jgi:phosphatidylinositol alpha-1,6-mannosyltransferase
LSLFFNRKIIGVVHGSELNLKNRISNGFTQQCLKRLDHLIAVSSYTKSFLQENDIPVTVINNGFNINTKQRKLNTDVERSEISLITVGNLTQRKGQHNLIRVIPILKKHFSKVTYNIVGIPTDQIKIEALAQNLEVADSIRIHGMVSEEQKVELLLGSDIFVMLSEEIESGDIEGFGIAILEANYLGLPAIGSKGTGIEDAISINHSGILVDSKDRNDINQSVLNIMDSYLDFSKQSILWAEKFTWSNIVQEYIKVIEL